MSLASGRSLLARTLAHLNDALLDPPHPPIGRHIADLRWAPDSPDCYCPVCAQSVGRNQLPPFDPADPEPPRCQRCSGERRAVTRVVRLGAYAYPLSEWVQDIKFHAMRRTARVLAEVLAESLRPVVAGDESAVVVPVPTARSRRIARGIDHPSAIAVPLARRLGLPIAHALRARHHAPQRTLALADRRSNASGAYARRSSARTAGRHVILIDDVSTSGSTFAAAALALQGRPHVGVKPASDAPARVTAAVLAVTPAPGEHPRPGHLSTANVDKTQESAFGDSRA